MLSKEISELITMVSRLPGMGERSATRIIIHLLKNKTSILQSLIKSLSRAHDLVCICNTCNNIDASTPCSICGDKRRDKSTVCVVCDISDLWSIEMANFFNGTYHVLGGKLSAIEGITPEDLKIKSLVERIRCCNIKEVIIATSADIDGQTTLFYVYDQLREFKDVKITTLSHGVPVGTSFEYLDNNTIITAFNRRIDV